MTPQYYAKLNRKGIGSLGNFKQFLFRGKILSRLTVQFRIVSQ